MRLWRTDGQGRPGNNAVAQSGARNARDQKEQEGHAQQAGRQRDEVERRDGEEGMSSATHTEQLEIGIVACGDRSRSIRVGDNADVQDVLALACAVRLPVHAA